MAPNTFYYGLPVFVILMILELRYSFKEHNSSYEKKDCIQNILAGIGYFLTNFIAKLFVFAIYQFIYEHRIYSLGDAWWVWLLALIAHDFSFYWHHRISHTVNWFWASHSVHHSSENFNLTTAFRMPWTDNLTGQFIFWLWIPLIGFHPFIIMLVGQVAIFYGAIMHTEAVNKLHPAIEFVFNTPSHHRVHHSSSIKYLDKNHGEVFIIWDRLFGTFQEEEEHPKYGLTTKEHFKNAVDMEFNEWRKLMKKIQNSVTWKQALNYMIKPPGWSHDGSSKTVKQMRKSVSMGW